MEEPGDESGLGFRCALRGLVSANAFSTYLCAFCAFLRLFGLVLLSRQTQLTQQRFDLRFAAAEFHERFHRVAAAAFFKNCAQEAA